MRRIFTLTFICSTLLLGISSNMQAGTGFGGDPALFDFWGFSIAPDPVEPGDELRIVGVLNGNTTTVPLHLDFNNYEYTVYIHKLWLDEVIPGPVTQYNFSGGILAIYADASFNAPFRFWTDPDQVPALDPAQVPSTFTDGNLLARFRFQDYISLFFQSAGIGTIAYSATELQLKNGAALRTFRRLRMLSDWHMGGGFTDDEHAYIPDGYGCRYDALTQWEGPLPVEPSTWGGIKAIYR